MPAKYHRLDRFLSQRLSIKRADIRPLLAQKRIRVDGVVATDIQQRVGPFTRVEYDDHVVQACQPKYLQLYKPAGVVSATKDPKHPTVMDYLPDAYRHDDLHLVGRLDFNTTGLVVLTNDGDWSRRICLPSSAVGKRYVVSVDQPITAPVIDAFREGIFFAYEGITTRPATLVLQSPTQAIVTIHEGKYHQIKRMFGRFQLTVCSLHRVSIGTLELDPQLQPGQYRVLTEQEVQALA